MFELEELDNRPTEQMTPARVLWYGCGRKILFVSVQVSEQTTEGEWRLMRELKPFRTHVRHEGPVGKLIAKARQKYGMKYDDWKIAEVEYDTERFVCQFESSKHCARRIECVLKRRMSFAAVEGSKERDEGSPTSGAWGGTVERCVSGGGAVVRGLSVLEKRLRGRF